MTAPTNTGTGPASLWLLLALFIFVCKFPFTVHANYDAAGQKVTFYPSSLMVARKSKAIVFFQDTRLVNVRVDLSSTQLGRDPELNISCSSAESNFFSNILHTVRSTQRVIKRLDSRTGFSNLVECDTYLRCFYYYQTGTTAKMVCSHRAYRNSITECKAWAKDHCTNFSPNERSYLRHRTRRSSFLCHSGFFSVFRTIYTSLGGNCESNHVSHLKASLRGVTDAMSTQESTIHSVNRKVVYLIKTMDELTRKLNALGSSLRQVDKTFSDWQKAFASFSSAETCHAQALSEFISKYTVEVNRAFFLLLRSTEIDELVRQLSEFSHKTLVGYADFPNFLTTELDARLLATADMADTLHALKEGFPLFLNPMVDYDHQKHRSVVNILLTIPVLPKQNSLCTMEYLEPFVYKFHNVVILDQCPSMIQL